MNKLLYLLFLSIFLFEYLSDIGLFGRYITWFPEFISMLTIIIISARITVGYGRYFPPICSLFLVLFFSNIIIGAVINHISSGPLIAGIRMYLKPIPFFILPFVYHFSSNQLNKQLKLLLFFFIIQTPVSLYQRLVVSTGLRSQTGDYVKGTLISSGHLTIILVCAISVLMSFYLAKKINFRFFIVIFFLLFIPMTINETKATIIFLPMALVLPIYFSENSISMKQFVPMIILGIVAGILFVFIYDHFVRERWGYGIVDFLFMEDRVEGYLYKGSEVGYGSVGRVDSYIFAFQEISKNILNLLFGFGIGNVSESFSPSLSGEYADKYSSLGVKMTSFTLTLWERGVSGVFLYYFLFFMVFKYSRRLSIRDSSLGALSNGWSVISLLMMIFVLYSHIILENTIGYLFWYFSGYIISENFKYKKLVT